MEEAGRSPRTLPISSGETSPPPHYDRTVTGTYPAHREADVVLRDGSTVRVRPVRAGDQEALRTFRAARRRVARVPFLLRRRRPRAGGDRPPTSTTRDRFGLVATRGEEERVVAHAVYVRRRGGRAEVAFAVADELQGRGRRHDPARPPRRGRRAAGIETFTADVLPREPPDARGVPRQRLPASVALRAGAARRRAADVAHAGGESTRFEERDEVAAAAAVARVLEPASVALIGASRRRARSARRSRATSSTAGFAGAAAPRQPPRPSAVRRCRPTGRVPTIPGPVDLAVIAVPAAAVVEVARECAGEGAPGARRASPPASPRSGPEGARRQRELLDGLPRGGHAARRPQLPRGPQHRARRAAERDVRPDRAAAGQRRLHVAERRARDRRDRARPRARPRPLVVRLGRQQGRPLRQRPAPVLGGRTRRTDVVLLYLESFGNPRRFARIARARRARRSRSSPSRAGARRPGPRAAGSHTGALLAASDVTVDALFRQAGVIRADTLGELFDVAALLAGQPLPAGRRVAISPTPAARGSSAPTRARPRASSVPTLPTRCRQRCAPSCAGGGGRQPGRPDRRRLRGGLPARARRARRRTAVDALIVIFVPPLVTRAEDVAAAMRRRRRGAAAAGRRSRPSS